jgi:arsenate reductase-like glutaredoxin family protein
MSCTRAQEFLEKSKIDASSVSDARKEALGRKAALQLASQVDEIYAAKGSKVVHVDMRTSKPSEEELAEVLLGPTGNLRAPAIRAGKKLLVGFNADLYKKLLGS